MRECWAAWLSDQRLGPTVMGREQSHSAAPQPQATRPVEAVGHSQTPALRLMSALPTYQAAARPTILVQGGKHDREVPGCTMILSSERLSHRAAIPSSSHHTTHVGCRIEPFVESTAEQGGGQASRLQRPHHRQHPSCLHSTTSSPLQRPPRTGTTPEDRVRCRRYYERSAQLYSGINRSVRLYMFRLCTAKLKSFYLPPTRWVSYATRGLLIARRYPFGFESKTGTVECLFWTPGPPD